MKRDFLKGLELEDEVIEKIMAEHGKTVGANAAELETLKSDKETLQEQLNERNKDLEALKDSANLSEEQKKEFEALQERYDTEKSEWEAKLQENEKQAAYEVAIAKLNVIDPVALKAHTQDFYKEAEFKDGELVGFEKHAQELLKDKLSYLVPKDTKATGDLLETPPKETNKEDQIKEKMGL